MNAKDTPQHGDPVEVAPAVIDYGAASVQRAADLGQSYGTPPRQPQAAAAAVVPTQVRRPWRSTARTVFQATVALAAMWAVVVQAAGLPDWAWVGSSVAIAGGITRVMALPTVEAWLRRFVPFLAAAPKPKGR